MFNSTSQIGKNEQKNDVNGESSATVSKNTFLAIHSPKKFLEENFPIFPYFLPNSVYL